MDCFRIKLSAFSMPGMPSMHVWWLPLQQQPLPLQPLPETLGGLGLQAGQPSTRSQSSSVVAGG